MQKRVIIIILITSILFLTACSMPSINLNNLFGGSSVATGKGVKMEFLNYPKGQLYGNQQFYIKMKLTNYGVDSVDGTLCLLTSTPSSFGGIPANACKEVHLDKAEKLSDKTISEYSKEFVFPNEQGGTYSFTNLQKDITESLVITAELKYALEQKSTAKICIKNPSVESAKSIPVPCDDTQTLTVEQPDYPVKVTKIEKEVVPIGNSKVQIRLAIHVKKDEDGEVIPRASILSDKPSFLNTVEFLPELSGIQAAFTCSPLKDNTFELAENEKVINCFVTTDINQDYLYDTLIINLGYGFRKTQDVPAVNLISSQTAVA